MVEAGIKAGLFSSRLFHKTIAIVLVFFAATVCAKAATITVAPGGDLQSAVNAAQYGDTIVLQAGAVYTVSLTLPLKSGTGEIVIQSSRASELPDGVRVTPAQNGLLAKLQSITPAEAVVKTVAGAHHYRFVGIEFSTANAGVVVYDLIRFGGGRDTQTTLASVPHHLVIDRCYIHGFDTQDVQRGISLNSAETTVSNSYISEIHGVGFDTQAVGGWNGPGPFHVVNNYLEGAGENVMFGGADPAASELTPSNIEIRGNYVPKPLKWKVGDPSYAGTHWTVKNLLELKNAKNVVIDGNVFENNWQDGQAGVGILLTVRNQECTAPYSTVQNVTFTNNTVRNSEGGGLNFLGKDNEAELAYGKCTNLATMGSVRGSGVSIANNLFYNNGGAFLTINGFYNVTLNRNTHVQRGNLTTVYGEPSLGFGYTNNLTIDHDYGIFGDGGLIGTAALNSWTPGWVMTGNVIATPYGSYPAGNSYPASLSLPSDWRSPIPGVGADIDALNAAQGGTAPSPSPSPTPTPTPTPNPSPTPTPTPSPSAVVSFVQADSTTKGNWKNNYGGDGFNTVNDIATYPSYAQVSVSGYASPTWAASTTDTRALQKDLAADRIAARWESSGSSFFTIDLNITDGQSHQVALYSLDWDGTNRSQRVDIMDWASGALLDSQSISQFNGGKYLVWNVKGHVRITVNKTGAKTAVVSGLYFGNAAATPPPPTPTPTPTPAPLVVAITSPSNNTTFSYGTSVTLEATATDTAGTVTSVKFYAGSQLVGTSNIAPFSVAWSNIAAGTYSVTATALDNQGLSVTSSPITVKISKTLKSVRSNRQNTTNLSAADSLAVNTEASQPTVALDSLVTDLEQTYNDFNGERSMFNSEPQIDKYLLASLLLARSSAALAKQPSTSVAVVDRLNKIEAYLSFCEDLMVSDSISPQSLADASKANAQVNLLIAQPSTGPISLPGVTIWPNLSAKIDTTFAIPFATQTSFVPIGMTSYELANVSVTIGGKAAAVLMVSPNQITFVVPGGLSGGLADVVVTSRGGSIFHGSAAVVGLHPTILGLIGDTSGQAAAQDAVAFQSGAFSTTGASLYGLDSRTRVAIWASGISTGITNSDTSNDIFMGLGQVIENLSESVKVEARTSDGTVYLLPVEFAGTPGTLPGLDQVNAVLVPELRGAGTVELTIVVGTVRSNTMTITVQ